MAGMMMMTMQYYCLGFSVPKSSISISRLEMGKVAATPGADCGAGMRCRALRAASGYSYTSRLYNTNKNIENFAIKNMNNKKNSDDNMKKNGPLSTLKKALFLSLLLLNAYIFKLKEFVAQKSSDFVKLTKYLTTSSPVAQGGSRGKPATPIAKLARAFLSSSPLVKASMMTTFYYVVNKIVFGAKKDTFVVSYANFLKLIAASPSR